MSETNDAKTYYNQELYVEQAIAILNPKDSSKVMVGLKMRKRLDLNIMKDPVHGGEYVTNNIYRDAKGNYQVNHFQVASLQMLNDIIECSNETKIKNKTGQRLLKPYTVSAAIACAKQGIPLVVFEDDVFFVADVKRRQQSATVRK